MNLLHYCTVISYFSSVWNYAVPYSAAEWLHLVLNFSAEYHNSRQNIIILSWKYSVDISREAWQNLFWEHINRKLFAVYA